MKQKNVSDLVWQEFSGGGRIGMYMLYKALLSDEADSEPNEGTNSKGDSNQK